MKTLVFTYNSCSDKNYIQQRIINFSCCLRYIYKNYNKISDKDILSYCKSKWELNDIEVRSVACEVKQIKTGFESKKKKVVEEINELQDKLFFVEDEINKTTSKSKKKKLKLISFKIKNKINYKERFLESDVLNYGGFIYIAEPTSSYEDINELKTLITENGFSMVGDIENRGKFTYIIGTKA